MAKRTTKGLSEAQIVTSLYESEEDEDFQMDAFSDGMSNFELFP